MRYMRSLLNCVVASCEHVEARIETEGKQQKETGAGKIRREREREMDRERVLKRTKFIFHF